jgi:hypothetical protein
MRRRSLFLFFLLTALIGALVPLPAGPAAAIDAPAATLTLQQQSPWNGPGRPLKLRLKATNTGGTTLTDLSVAVTVEAPARTRGSYLEAMKSDSTGTTGIGGSFPEAGSIAPQASMTFSLHQSLKSLVALGESALYPVRIDLLASLRPVATLRTPMIFLTEPPKLPLNVSTTWVLWDPLQIRPDGILGQGPIERDIAPGGRLDLLVRALKRAPPAVNVVMSPVLAKELEIMAGGYRIVRGGVTEVVPKGTGGSANAQAMLSTLRSIAARPSVEIVAPPFGDPSIAALVRSGLARELPALADRGRADVGSVLGRQPAAHVARPPFSQLEPASLARMSRIGDRIVLLDPGVAPTPPGIALAGGAFGSPLPVSTLAAGSRTVTAVVPDEQLAEATRAGTTKQDSMLAAHVALGELAVVYFETPGTPRRGSAIMFPEREASASAFYLDFARLLAGAPWLTPVTASKLVATVRPPSVLSHLEPASFLSFPASFRAQYQQVQEALLRFSSSVLGAKPLTDRLGLNLQLSLSGGSLRSLPTGRGFLQWDSSTIQRTLSGLKPPPTGRTVTLTSLHGSVYFTVRNDATYRMKTVVRLVPHGQLTVPGGEVVLYLKPGESRLLRMDVEAKATGRFPLTVQILAPEGGLIAQSQMIVRSTAYNRVALVVTLGAALFLLALWGRRFLPRPTS